MERLNPKLTRRSLAANLPIGEINSDSQSEDNSTSRSGTTTTSGTESTTSSGESLPIIEAPKNPKLHLLHNGKWIPKKFEVGRHVPRTGIWDCCGDQNHFSLYCDSLDQREIFFQFLQQEEIQEIQEFINRMKRKEDFQNVIKENSIKGQKVEAPYFLTESQKAFQAAVFQDNSFNAPTLVGWIIKNVNEELTMLKGLDYVLFHMKTGEGCLLLFRHGIVTAVTRILTKYPNHPPLALLVVQILRQLLDCNFTRDELIENTEIFHLVMVIAHKYMNSIFHVDNAMRCLMQCVRSECNREYFFAKDYIGYLFIYAKRFRNQVSLLSSILRAFFWVMTDEKRIKTLFQFKIIQLAIKSMNLHRRQRDIFIPALMILKKIILTLPDAMVQLLKSNIVPLIIEGMQIIYDDQEVQLEALKLLKAISLTSEGWKQISDVKGGWQSITQGTLFGDSLVHELKGHFHNPGWSIGDTPNLPELEKRKLAAAENSKNSLENAPKVTWTASSLREYMGLSMAGQTLAINTDHHNIYFELLTTLDLLPQLEEQREYWFQRVRKFEKENDVMVEDMVGTVMEMRKREAIRKKQLAQSIAMMKNGGDEELGSLKELYVNGELVTMEKLQEKDTDINETLLGIL